jgi:hypothetical protein
MNKKKAKQNQPVDDSLVDALMDEAAVEACENCKYYGSDSAVCRRHPPVLVSAPSLYRQLGAYPGVKRVWWCGEYRPC